MPYDDGDALPEGHYVADKDGKLVRTGPGQVETGWHGTSAPADTAIDLELRAPGVDGRNHLREVPAIYTITDPLIAQRVAFNRWRRQRDAGKGVEQRPQLYEIVAAPSETVELGDCTDAPSVIAAIDLGADVLECPDWVNGSLPVPETVILNDDIHHTGRAWQIDELKDLDVSEAMVRAENALIAAPMLSPSIKRAKGMPKYTRYTAQPAKPRKSKASKPKYRHPFLRKRR